MSTTYVGNLSLSAAIPGGASAAAAGEAGINLALPDIQARIEALLAFNPQPIDFTASLTLAQSIVANIQAAIALGITPPSISAQIALVGALVADLEAAVISINANLQIVLDFLSLLVSAGVHVYSFSGEVDQLGPELTTLLAGGLPGEGDPDAASNALVMMTTTSATWTAMQSIFKTSP